MPGETRSLRERAAGCSMMHRVPGIILRVLVVKFQVPLSSRRFKLMVAVDGKVGSIFGLRKLRERSLYSTGLKRGDFIEVEASQYPIPTVCKSSVTADGVGCKLQPLAPLNWAAKFGPTG
eukprot:s1141_g31.t1